MNTVLHVITNDKTNPWNMDSYSFTSRDILSLSKDYEIFATPHIGLHWPSNSMYTHMGVGICQFTSNQSIRDVADMPEYLGLSNNLKKCAHGNEQLLSPYLKINPDILRHGNMPEIFQKYAKCNNLAHVHHSAKKSTLEGKIILDVDILEGNFIREALAILIKNEEYILNNYRHFATRLFNRFIDKRGVAQEKSLYPKDNVIDSFLELKQRHKNMILQDTIDNPSGFIPIKEVMIFLDTLRCYYSHLEKGNAQNPEIGDSYIVSGVSMIDYLKNPRTKEVLQKMYEVAQKEIEWLPKIMRLFVIPGGVFQFLPSSGEPELEESILEVIDEYAILSEKKEVISRSKGRDINAIADRKICLQKMLSLKRTYAEYLKTRKGFNQYDLLNGEKVNTQIPNKVMDFTFGEIKSLFFS